MTIPAERLREGQQILVRGKISFSRLARLIEGDALAKRVDAERKRGSLYPTTVPHTTISLVDAQVLAANPAAPTVEEQFVHEKIFSIAKGDNAGKQGFSIDNKSNYLPTVLEPDTENPGQYRQLVLDRDLATGLEVTLVIETYKPQGYEKRGLGLQQVVLMEAPRYYSSGIDTSALAARGIVVNGPIRSVSGAESPAPVDSATAQAEFASEASLSGFPVPANSQADANGFAVPAPGAQGIVPAAAPAAFPVSQPVVAPVVAQAPAAAPIAGVLPGETAEQAIARLQQQVAEQQAAQAGSGGGSPFDVAPAAAAAAPGPWDVPGQGPSAYQG